MRFWLPAFWKTGSISVGIRLSMRWTVNPRQLSKQSEKLKQVKDGIIPFPAWMKKNVQIDEQVKQFIQSLSPEPRKELRRGLTGLENGEGDIEPLRGNFEGLFRLRVKTRS